MMCGLRMMLAGVLLYLWSWARGERNLPTRKDLSQSFVLAFFMVFMASGFLAKGQDPSPLYGGHDPRRGAHLDGGSAAGCSATIPGLR